MYFIDEFNGGAIYRYTSLTPGDGSTFFAAGQTSVLKVGDGTGFEATGGATWVTITNASGVALAGITLNADGSIDGRAAAAFVGATKFNRPEDLEIQTLRRSRQLVRNQRVSTSVPSTRTWPISTFSTQPATSIARSRFQQCRSPGQPHSRCSAWA